MKDKRVRIKTLQEKLDTALALINEHSADDFPNVSGSIPDVRSLANTDSLIERCANLVDAAAQPEKPVIRVIRHLACSGGTLVAKCIASMPNVYILSELHSRSTLHMGGDKAKFLPTDVASQARYANVPDADGLADELLRIQLKTASEHVRRYGGSLVVRAHSHSDFCLGDVKFPSCRVSSLLEPDFEVLALTTVRNPIDAYLSLSRNQWVHFEPRSFDEYCRRYVLFLEAQDDAILSSYEDFVKNPVTEMVHICDALCIPYDEVFEDIFSLFNVSGDSGRSGDTISERSRIEMPEHLVREIGESSHYQLLIDKLQALELKSSVDILQ